MKLNDFMHTKPQLVHRYYISNSLRNEVEKSEYLFLFMFFHILKPLGLGYSGMCPCNA